MKILEDVASGTPIAHYLLERNAEILADSKTDFQGNLRIMKIVDELLNKPRMNRKRFLFKSIYLLRFNGDGGIDNDSAKSRDALIEAAMPGVKRRYSNASQSSHEFLDGERPKNKQEKSKNIDDPLNVGSIVGIDRLFEGGDCATESRANKSKLQLPSNYH